MLVQTGTWLVVALFVVVADVLVADAAVVVALARTVVLDGVAVLVALDVALVDALALVVAPAAAALVDAVDRVAVVAGPLGVGVARVAVVALAVAHTLVAVTVAASVGAVVAGLGARLAVLVVLVVGRAGDDLVDVLGVAPPGARTGTAACLASHLADVVLACLAQVVEAPPASAPPAWLLGCHVGQLSWFLGLVAPLACVAASWVACCTCCTC